ncbi:MAG: hypothetical protein D6747_01825 [Chlorobiota bacterium]|jgi:hypothetical protein|nr:MAG: hypothetical protein D6747_01825 [Chlorobiota bacterium]
MLFGKYFHVTNRTLTLLEGKKMLLALIVVAILISACRENPADAVLSPKMVWRTPLTVRELSEYQMHVICYNREIIVVVGVDSAGEQVLLGLDAATGKELWRWKEYYVSFDFKTWIPFVWENYLVFGSGGRRYCIDMATGRTVWRMRDDYTNGGEFVRLFEPWEYSFIGDLGGDTAVGKFGCFASDVRHPIPTLLYQNIAMSGLCLPTAYVNQNGERVLLFVEHDWKSRKDSGQLTSNSYLFCYRLSDNTTLYRVPYARTRNRGLVDNRPGVIYNNKYYKDAGQRIVCYDPDTGRLIWYQDFPGDFLFSGFIDSLVAAVR